MPTEQIYRSIMYMYKSVVIGYLMIMKVFEFRCFKILMEKVFLKFRLV